MDIETANDDLVGWYRNPTGGKGCVRIPYRGDNHDRAMYPDFILFHQTDNGIRPSIVDPHGHHLSDARSKLRGLADYAEDHGSSYARIESVIRADDGHLLALDMKSEVIRAAVREPNDTSVEALFINHGGSYN